MKNCGRREKIVKMGDVCLKGLPWDYVFDIEGRIREEDCGRSVRDDLSVGGW